jgi:hypothetical protein
MRAPEPSEKQIQTAVLTHWRTFGVPGSLVAAIPNARAAGQSGLTPGLYDLLVIGGSVRIAFLELKKIGGKTSQAQRDFADILSRAGIRHAVAYGRDEPIVILEQWGIVKETTHER